MLVKKYPITNILCPKCNGRNVVCRYQYKQTELICIDCSQISDISAKVYIRKINQLRLPPDSSWINVFFGPWNIDEIDLLESSCSDIAKDFQKVSDEWHFFKGRNLYTAWRYSWVSGRVITEPTLDDLIDEVEVLCQKIHQ